MIADLRVCARSLLAGLLLIAPSARAQAQMQFRTITSFGESYLDTGNLGYFKSVCGACLNGIPAAALANYPRHDPWPSNPATDATQIVPLPYKLQQLYGVSDDRAFNYAIAGAATNAAIGNLGESNQVATFLSQGGRLGPSDLVMFQALGNDAFRSRLVALGKPMPASFLPNPLVAPVDTGNPVVDANAEAGRALTNFGRLVGAGMRNVSVITAGDLGALAPWVPPSSPPFITESAQDVPALHAYANTAFSALQAGLVPFARAGVRVFLFDLRVLQQRLIDTPQMYGYASLGDVLRPDGLHYTEAGFGLIARYVQNQIDAPTTVVPQGAIVLTTARNFAEMIFGRLDAFRYVAPPSRWDAGRIGGADESPSASTSSYFEDAGDRRWSAYADLNYTGSTWGRRFYASSANYESSGGSGGLEYQINPDWKLGLALGYARPNVDLGTQDAHLRIDALQFSSYSSYTALNWFSDVLLAYGHQSLNGDRRGIIDVIHSSAGADLFTAATRAGYLFDAGSLRIGPVWGLSFTSGSIASYMETGDALITQTVDRQSLNSLTGSAGVQVRLPFSMGAIACNSFVTVTGEHEFLGRGRGVTTTQLTTPLLPVVTPVDDGGRVYGKVAAGLQGRFAANLSGGINAYATFGRSDENLFGFSGSVSLAF